NSERKSGRRDKGYGPNLPGHVRFRRLCQRVAVHTDIAPAAARHKTTDPSTGQAKRQARGECIHQSAQIQLRGSSVNDQRQNTKDHPAIKDHAASTVSERLPQTHTGRKIKKPTEQTGAEQAKNRDEEDQIIDVCSLDATTNSSPARQQLTGEQAKQQKRRIG